MGETYGGRRIVSCRRICLRQGNIESRNSPTPVNNGGGKGNSSFDNASRSSTFVTDGDLDLTKRRGGEANIF